MTQMTTSDDPLLLPDEVASALRVDVQTVTRWARDGRIASITLPSGQRRYRRSVLDAILAGASGSA